MNNSTPLPPTFTEQPLRSLNTENTPNYVGFGVFIGFIVALVIVGGVYFKMRLDALSSQSSSPMTKSLSKQEESDTVKTTLVPTVGISPTIAPASIQSSEDLTAQEKLLDSADISSLSSELDQNAIDATQFAQ